MIKLKSKQRKKAMSRRLFRSSSVFDDEAALSDISSNVAMEGEEEDDDEWGRDGGRSRGSRIKKEKDLQEKRERREKTTVQYVGKYVDLAKHDRGWMLT